MTINRYARTRIFGINKHYGTSYAIPTIRDNIKNKSIRTREIVLKESVRMDVLAGREYGDATLYWIICAASDIGWTLQVPPGTKILIPNLEDVAKFF